MTVRLLALILCALPLAAPVYAQERAPEPEIAPKETLIRDGTEATLAEFHWIKRPVVVFADSPNDPRFQQQMEFIERDMALLTERDVVVLVDTDPAARSALRQRLRPREFALVLIGKDGEIELRKPRPWQMRELSRVIDKMPLRQQEIREGRGIGEVLRRGR